MYRKESTSVPSLSKEAELMNDNFIEVSSHNLGSSQTRGFCMDFVNHREEVSVSYHVFFLSPLQCTVTEF